MGKLGRFRAADGICQSMFLSPHLDLFIVMLRFLWHFQTALILPFTIYFFPLLWIFPSLLIFSFLLVYWSFAICLTLLSVNIHSMYLFSWPALLQSSSLNSEKNYESDAFKMWLNLFSCVWVSRAYINV